ncbi:hypothetical protein E2C01_094253 [Portunus trituberculatus]|uniref:Uncharacterized protein n=1 Tax=Portunus trituberculatus TaxID=210409 RepID=A0A5B7K150_PORTR|nr:hypothetical protein [Portunus trituberculatus]
MNNFGLSSQLQFCSLSREGIGRERNCDLAALQDPDTSSSVLLCVSESSPPISPLSPTLDARTGASSDHMTNNDNLPSGLTTICPRCRSPLATLPPTDVPINPTLSSTGPPARLTRTRGTGVGKGGEEEEEEGLVMECRRTRGGGEEEARVMEFPTKYNTGSVTPRQRCHDQSPPPLKLGKETRLPVFTTHQ